MQFRIIPALVASYLCFVQGQQQVCRTPSGGPGSCITLYDCKELLAIVNNPQKTAADVSMLRKSACGFQGSIPKVCCPEAVQSDDVCFTPNAQLGKCINLNSCAYLASLLTKPNADVIAFVQSSKCESSDPYSVCCGDSAPNFDLPKSQCRTPPTIAPPDPYSGCCGREGVNADRIFGGSDAAIDQYPWMALIEYTKNNQIKLLCGAALISGRYVLTAGHCVVGPVLNSGTPVNVRLGEYDTSNDPNQPDCQVTAGGGEDCTPGVVIIRIEKVIAHPDYEPNSSRRRHDIALIRLSETAPYTEFIRPICLPLKDITTSNEPDLTFDVAGWGAINITHSKSLIKQYVDVPYRNKDQCQPAYSVPRRKVDLWNGQLCAGGEPNKDSCKGDSGGPLMYDRLRTYEIVGVVSFGPTPCGIEYVPGVYTKVYQYMPWIRKNIKP